MLILLLFTKFQNPLTQCSEYELYKAMRCIKPRKGVATKHEIKLFIQKLGLCPTERYSKIFMQFIFNFFVEISLSPSQCQILLGSGLTSTQLL